MKSIPDEWFENEVTSRTVTLTPAMLARIERGKKLKAEQAKEVGKSAAAPFANGAGTTATKYSENQARDDHGRWTSGGSFSQVSAEKFIVARDASTRGQFLSSHSADELQDHKLYLAYDGKVGYALDTSGDLQNLFNNGGPKGAGTEALISAIKNGATTLDAFDNFLPGLYSRVGFKAVARLPFNREYAPEGWNYGRDGTPDVVFMAYRGGTRGTIKDRVGSFSVYRGTEGVSVSDYDDGKQHARDARMGARSNAGRTGVGGGVSHEIRAAEVGGALHRDEDGTGVRPPVLKYSPDQPRDDHGRWGSGGNITGVDYLLVETRARDNPRTESRYGDDRLPFKNAKDIQAFTQTMAKGFPASLLRVTMSVESRTGDVTMKIVGQTADEQSGFERQILFKEGVPPLVEHASFILAPELQGKGIAKEFLQSNIAAYKSIGVSTVELHANVDIGGYAWAKFGFLPVPGSIRALKDFGHLDENGKIKSPAALRALETLDNNKPRDLWKLADSAVGKEALLGTSWHGALHLDDPVAMRRFDNYIKRGSATAKIAGYKGAAVYEWKGTKPDGAVDGMWEFVNGPDVAKYSPDQPRDDHGRFGSGGSVSAIVVPHFMNREHVEGLIRNAREKAAADRKLSAEHRAVGNIGAADSLDEAAAEKEKFADEQEKSLATAITDYAEYQRQVVRYSAERLDAIKGEVNAMAKEQGFDPSRITVRTDDKTFVLNGETRHYSGSYDPSTGKIEVFADRVEPDTVRGLLAHEMMHDKFQVVYSAYEAERRRVMEDPFTAWGAKNAEGERTGMNADGSLPPASAGRYPAYQAFQENMSVPTLAKDDGVTSYSRDWWNAWETQNKTNAYAGEWAKSAINETFAEMARLTYTKQPITFMSRTPDGLLSRKDSSPVWAQMFADINRLYPTYRKAHGDQLVHDLDSIQLKPKA